MKPYQVVLLERPDDDALRTIAEALVALGVSPKKAKLTSGRVTPDGKEVSYVSIPADDHAAALDLRDNLTAITGLKWSTSKQ